MGSHPKVQFKVNLDDLFGERLNLNREIRESIGQAIIDRIVQRTSEENIDRFGRSLGTYTKSYAESDFGKIFGKKAGQPVSLLATGDMLGNMNIVEQSQRTLTIGFDNDEENTKAYGHVSGMKGHPVLEGKVKRRDFMGLPKSELNAIAKDFAEKAKSINSIESAKTREELNKAVTDLIDELNAEIGIETLDRMFGGG